MNTSLIKFSMLRSVVAVLTLCALFLQVAQQPAEAGWRKKPSKNLVETLEAAGNFSTLLTALELTGLKDTVATGGPFTVFTPTDDAFAALPDGTLEALINDPDTLTQILLYHVVDGKRSSYSMLKESTVTTLQGDPVIFSREGRRTLLVNNNPVAAVVKATNGKAYVINSVLLPPSEPAEVQSIADVLALDGRFTTLLAALQVTGLDEAIVTGDNFTVFAPTDEAFGALPEGTVEALIADPDALANILLYHVLGEAKSSWRLFWHRSATTLQGSDVEIGYNRGFLTVNGANVINPNVKAPNGIIQVIDSVLLPPAAPGNLVDVLEADGRFTTLLTALELTGLTDAVRDGELTIFAPTDEAFGALPEGTLEALIADPANLTDILLYHVTAGSQSARSLIHARSAETLQGESVHVRVVWWRYVFINNSRVIDADMEASNGIVHVIDAVLLPPPPSASE